MRTQNEQVAAEVAKERRELERNPEAEAEELAQALDRPRACRADLARAGRRRWCTRNPDEALRVHAQEELGVDPDDAPSPWTAAVSSFVCFSVGALVPLLPYLLRRAPACGWRSVAGGVGLFVAGALVARFTRRRWWAPGCGSCCSGRRRPGRRTWSGGSSGCE